MPKIYSGEWLSAICVTDEFAGVDPVSTGARAVYDAAKDEFVLNGIKTWVTNGSESALFTVFANVTAEEHAVNPLTAFLALLLEDLFDEWGTKIMFGMRWLAKRDQV